MLPYVNLQDGWPERLYISEYPESVKHRPKLMLVYRPTHEFMGCYTPKEIVAFWRMDTESFYLRLMDNHYFRLPRNGNYDFMVSGYYASCESSYERVYLLCTEQFRKKYRLPHLYEAIPYDFMRHIRNERVIRTGRNLTCVFNETEQFTMSGKWADWADEFLDALVNFEGHTKVDLFKHMREFGSIDIFKDILATLRNNNVHGITELKQLSKKQLARILVNAINSWKG